MAVIPDWYCIRHTRSSLKRPGAILSPECTCKAITHSSTAAAADSQVRSSRSSHSFGYANTVGESRRYHDAAESSSRYFIAPNQPTRVGPAGSALTARATATPCIGGRSGLQL